MLNNCIYLPISITIYNVECDKIKINIIMDEIMWYSDIANKLLEEYNTNAIRLYKSFIVKKRNDIERNEYNNNADILYEKFVENRTNIFRLQKIKSIHDSLREKICSDVIKEIIRWLY